MQNVTPPPETQQLNSIKDLLAERLVDAMCDGYPRPNHWVETALAEALEPVVAELALFPDSRKWLDNYVSAQLWAEARRRTS